jgi:amino acid adenylation domain-containing protein
MNLPASLPVAPAQPNGAAAADVVTAPTSFAQRRLWFLDQLGQDRQVYNLAYQINLHGPVDESALRRALTALARRHESLRVHFADEEGQPVQVVAAASTVELEVMDSASPELADQEARQVFDLARGPLWRVKLLRGNEQDSVLLWTMHHIIADAHAWRTLFRDLAAFYQEALKGTDETLLPALPLPYADFSRAQQEWVKTEAFARQMEYWRRQLSGTLPILQLPVSGSRSRVQTFRGACHSFALPAKLLDKLTGLGRQEEVDLAPVLLAGFIALLHRYSAQEDILVGTPVANRTRSELADVVGFFINLLVIRNDLSGDHSFRELLRRVRRSAREAEANQDLPFDLLVQEIRPEREATHQPLFQVYFDYDSEAALPLTAGGLTWTARPIHNGTSKFPLSLLLEETPEGLQSYFEYSTDLFEPEVIARMAGHLQTLLEGFAADPDGKLSRLPLLTEAERRQTLVEWNNTAVDYPRDRGVHQLFEAQASRTPERLAVLFQEKRLTYGELNARANQVAHHLRTLGVGPDVLVGLCMERSAEMMVGLLGILKAGGAYVPLDPEFPQDRLAFYVQDSAMPVLVASRRTLPLLPEHKARVVCLDQEADTFAKYPRDNLACETTASNLVYVIYTSGSTGKPKGVQVLHGALTNFLNSMLKQPGLTPEDVLLAITTLSFDIHTLEIWLPLVAGARVEILSRDVIMDGVKLAKTLERSGATLMQATPATWRLLLEAGWEGTPGLKALCGGEPMTVELAIRLLPRVGSLWNMYGPTETTVWSTLFQVTSAQGPISIGRPIDNTQIYLVDSHLNPVPVGVVGELLIGGDGLARGYLNRPELTAEKFIPDTFGSAASGREARVYRTGDLARYLPDGNLECLGRVDNQVKVRGFRIELGEIETALAKHPAVKNAVVVARKESSGSDYLAAYLIPQTAQACPADELRAFLLKSLPDYMVPSHFVSLTEFPLTPNGKIDRKALPAPQESKDPASRPIVSPRDDAEKDLVALWEEVLKVRPISVTDNFFDLGGHSFAAAVLIAKIRQRLGHTLPLGTLFAAPTVEKLAATLNHQLEAGTESSLVPLNEKGSRPVLFMLAGVGGHVFTFHKFARLLGPEQPVYGVKAIGVDGVLTPPDTVEEMAAHYVKEITAVRPTGSYILSGYSIGAIVALEVAVQLRALGCRVDKLMVFDMLAPGYPPKLPLPHRLKLHVQTFFGLPLAEKKTYLAERLHKIRVRIRHWTGQGIRNAPEIPVEGLPQDALKRVWFALATAASRYRPQKKFDGSVVLFKAEEGFHWPATIIDDPRYGWGQWTTRGVDVQTIPGGHMEMFHDEHISVLAGAVMQRIDAGHEPEA